MKRSNSWAFTPCHDVDTGERATYLAGSDLAGCTWGDTSLPAWAGRIAELEERERELVAKVDLALGTLERLKAATDVAARLARRQRPSRLSGVLLVLALLSVLGVIVARCSP